MSNYYKTLSQTIMQKLNDIDKGDFNSFYYYNVKFDIAMLISFFVLKEDEIISIDKSNPDIKTRYTLNIDQKELDDIFNLQNPITIISKEQDGNKIWFLSAIRNALMHDSSFEIDFENRIIEINSSYKLNKLHCKIPFDFFHNFMNIYIQKFRQTINFNSIYNHKFYGDFNIKYVEEYIENNNIKKLTNNDLKKCISLIKPTIFAIKKGPNCPDYDMKEVNLEIGLIYESIHNKEFPKDDKSHSNSKRTNPFYNAELKINLYGLTKQEYNKLSKSIKQELVNRGCDSYIIDKMTDELIKAKYINKMLDVKFPGLSVEIDSSTNIEISESDIITNGKVLDSQLNIDEQLEILNHFSSEKTYIMTSNINSFLQMLYYNYSQNAYNKDEILKYISLDDFKKYVTTTNPEEKTKISTQYYKNIETHFRDNNKTLHFNNAIIKDIFYNTNPKFYEEDIDTYNELILAAILRKDSTFIFNNETLEMELSEKYKWFVEKYSKKILETNRDVLSDETREFCFKNYSLQVWDGLYDSFNRNRLINAHALLYTMGINLFVLNKERTFDLDSRSQNYEMLENFTTYSIDAANNYQTIINRQTTLNKDTRRTVKRYNDVAANINIPAAKKEQILAGLQQDLKKLEDEKSIIDQRVSNSKVKQINGIDFRTEEDNTKKAKVIRNCLSHNGKINIKRDNNNKFTVELLDFNESGIATSYMEIPLDKLIDFINNEIHINVLEENEKEP